MSIRTHIPNALTTINVASGFLAIYLLYNGFLWGVICCIAVSLIADVLDGWAARKLGVAGPLGIQLDSLADMVTFGVLPGSIMMFLIGMEGPWSERFMGFASGILITTSAFWRLAKFNLDSRQSSGFLGLPTPAMTLYVAGLLIARIWTPDPEPFQLFSAPALLLQSLLLSWIMQAEVPMPGFKDAGKRKGLLFTMGAVIFTGSITTAIIAPYLLLWQALFLYICTASVFHFFHINKKP